MAKLDIDRLLEMLRDPNVESRDLADAAGVPREDAARAARLTLGIGRASADEVASLPAPLAVAVCRAALAAGRAEILAALAARPEKDVAKEAKRGLHLLRARGVSVPEPPRPAAAPAAPAPEPALPAYATAVDARGERAVWLPRTVPGKGVEIAQAVISDERGIVELQVGTVGRKEWRAIAKGLLERGAAMGLGEVERAHAASLLVSARALNDASGQVLPEGADLWLRQLGPAAPPPDPAARFAPLPEGEEREALAASGALHELRLLRSWLAEEDFLRQVAARLDEISVSPLYLDEAQRAAQAARTVADAVDSYFDERRRRALSSRLFSIAAHLEDGGDAPHARAAAAAARALAADVAPRAIPFARLLVEKAFPDVAPAPAGAPAAEPAAAPEPLIVTPR